MSLRVQFLALLAFYASSALVIGGQNGVRLSVCLSVCQPLFSAKLKKSIWKDTSTYGEDRLKKILGVKFSQKFWESKLTFLDEIFKNLLDMVETN